MMIDLDVYDTIQKLVESHDDTLEKYILQFGVAPEENKIGINGVQSLVRQIIVEDNIDYNPTYSRLKYGKGGYESLKLSNLEFDINFLIAIMSNVPGIAQHEKWAIIMVILTILAEIKQCKIQLQPNMSMIVTYLYNNDYQIKSGKCIDEDDLKKQIKSEFKDESGDEEFYDAINGLNQLNVISVVEGKVQLIEKVTKQ